MIKINEAIVVEGKYDKIKLSSIVDATIISTNGFRIFSDQTKIDMIKKLAAIKGILILTDSDVAGFKIRNFLCGIVDNNKIKHIYIPNILGKEKRKSSYSKEGFLGVEGVETQIIIKALTDAGTIDDAQTPGFRDKNSSITKMHLFEDGLIGSTNSYQKRQLLIQKLNLPKYLSTNALISALNNLISIEEYKNLINE